MQEIREKVIKGLECCCIHGNCAANGGCPYNSKIYKNCFDSAIKEAIVLLKAQEPRVLTLEELRALPEEPQTPLAMEERVPIGTWDGGSVVGWKGSLFIQEEYLEDGYRFYNVETYGMLWRVWTAWPDKAAREAEPWQSA